jgi:hypothetical protein
MIWIDKSRWARNFSNPIYFQGSYVPPLVLMPPVLNTTPKKELQPRRERRPFSRRHPAALRIPVIQVDAVLPNSHFHSSVASVCVSWTRKTTNCVPKVPPLANANAVIDMLGVYYPAQRGAEQNRKIPIGDPHSIQTGPNGTMGQNGSK